MSATGEGGKEGGGEGEEEEEDEVEELEGEEEEKKKKLIRGLMIAFECLLVLQSLELQPDV